jgi:putative ubiquitin-RnfH superfamily antitoxin RatB of RatAB toxin-antitoxin module
MSALQIEIVYALAERQVLRRVSLPEGSTVDNAVHASGLRAEFPEIDAMHVGIYGKAVSKDTLLRDRDRVELYRPLEAEPKEIRRARAAKRRAKK